MGQDFLGIQYLMHTISRFEHVYVEMEPGDALFFHSNLLHTSDQNKVFGSSQIRM